MEELDLNNEETSSSSPESQGEQKERFIPESRFKEVYGTMKNLEREITSLKEVKAENNLSDEQQKELQAKEYLKNLLKETLDEQKQSQSKQEADELEKFKSDVEEVISLNEDVKKEDFLKFLEKEGDDYASISSAMKGYRRLNETAADASEKAKKEIARKPSLPSSQGSSGGSEAYDDSGKSLWQIAQEAARELSKK